MIKNRPSITLIHDLIQLSLFSFRVIIISIAFIIRNYSHQQIFAPTPSCVFVLDLRLYNAPCSPYTWTPLIISLLLYNADTKVFLRLWNRTYLQHKVEYIVTYGKFPSFYASVAPAILSFLKTNNVSGYLMTTVVTEALYNHHFYARPETTILCHKFQHLLHFTHTPPNYAKNSFWKIILTYGVPTYIQSYIHIMSLSRSSRTTNSFAISLYRLTPHVKIASFTEHTSIHTFFLTCFFKFYFQKGLNQISASTLAQVLQYRPFIKNVLY